MLVIQKLDRDEWADAALFPFEENSRGAIERSRVVARALRHQYGGVWRIVARGDAPAGCWPDFKDGEVLWAS